MEQLKINSGLYQLQVVDETGKELGILSFNPMDFNLPARLDKGWKKIQKCLEEAKKAFSKYADTEDTDVQMDDTFAEVAEIISDMDAEIKQQLNYIFDTDISSVFGNTHLATPTKEGFLIENFIYAFMPVLEREMQKAQAASAKRKEKYTARYHK
ncbi:MAG: hypothetical protein NC311_08720 [Muribaculaceae bacterium]|nr:hypothetical protein [Muribaculaceae bacterium]MCM1399866.1 hypothetical protein [Clostridium sp.]MCM1460649.1 hypothetical protein [Bacteroides sp.]